MPRRAKNTQKNKQTPLSRLLTTQVIDPKYALVLSSLSPSRVTVSICFCISADSTFSSPCDLESDSICKTLVSLEDIFSFSYRNAEFFLRILLRNNSALRILSGTIATKNSVTVQLLYSEMPTDTKAPIMLGMSTWITLR